MDCRETVACPSLLSTESLWRAGPMAFPSRAWFVACICTSTPEIRFLGGPCANGAAHIRAKSGEPRSLSRPLDDIASEPVCYILSFM
jgi:hypothetical protein